MQKNQKDNLIYFKSKWNYPKTKVIRVPENLADQLLKIAYQLDNNKDIINQQDSLVTEQLKEIFIKICNKESGYKSNSATKLINDIKQLNQLSN
jgi:hypothetical protein